MAPRYAAEAIVRVEDKFAVVQILAVPRQITEITIEAGDAAVAHVALFGSDA